MQRPSTSRTGALRWAWDPDPAGLAVPQREGPQVSAAGTPNVWSILSGDRGARPRLRPDGQRLTRLLRRRTAMVSTHYASSVRRTGSIDSGAVAWYFQTVHHDVWDYDVASQPTLFEFDDGGDGSIPALAQATKMGHIFLLNRETGEPLFPSGGAPGTRKSDVRWRKATQPDPALPHSPRHRSTPPPSPPTTPGASRRWDRAESARERHRRTCAPTGIFTPASLRGHACSTRARPEVPNWGSVARSTP